jgi:acyl-ACP thioesterase
VKKIHCAIKFNQKAWLKPYIDLNTKLRQESTSEFDKDFFKLMNNSVYGKTIENIVKRQNITFSTERKTALKYVNKLTLRRETVFSKNLVAIYLNKEKV